MGCSPGAGFEIAFVNDFRKKQLVNGFRVGLQCLYVVMLFVRFLLSVLWKLQFETDTTIIWLFMAGIALRLAEAMPVVAAVLPVCMIQPCCLCVACASEIRP